LTERAPSIRMSLATLREKMEREFFAVRNDLKRLEGLLAAGNRDAEALRKSKQSLDRALALLRRLEWTPVSALVSSATPSVAARSPDLRSFSAPMLVSSLAAGGS
jgi:hypothetical protein